jgi:hypothetical protein
MKKYLNKIWFLLFIFLISLIGCNNKNDNISKVKIFGNFKFSKGEMLYLYEILVYEKEIIDSVNINEDGSFEFDFEVDDATILWLGFDSDNYVTLICDRDEIIEVNSNIRTFPVEYEV